VAPIPVALGAGSCLVLLRRWRVLSSRAALACALGFALVGVRAGFASWEGTTAYERARGVVVPRARCSARATVTSSPTVRGGQTHAVVDLHQPRCAGAPHPHVLRARLSGLPDELGRGDELELEAELGLVHLFANEGVGSGIVRVASTGVVASGRAIRVDRHERGGGVRRAIDAARLHVRRRIEATYHPSARGLARALVLGETDLDEAESAAFRVTGLSHLLAVSGTHLVVAVGSIVVALRAALLRVPPLSLRIDVTRVAMAIGVPLAWLYGELAGGSGSVLRAAAMLSAASASRWLDRRPDAARVFALALLVGVAVDPLSALDVSFGLSAAATGGLLLASEPTARWIGARAEEDAPPWRGLARGLAQAVASTLAATMACAPIIATMSPTLPVVGLAANVIAAPLGELFALPFCLAHAALAWAPPLETLAAWIGGGALRAVSLVARGAAATGLALPVPTPTPGQLVVVASVALLAATSRERRRAVLLVGALALLSLELGARRAGAPRGLLRISALDVAQGDALVVDLPDGRVMLVDTGGLPGGGPDVGERVVVPVLRARRRAHLDVVVITHAHPDHHGGLEAVAEAVTIRELWHPGTIRADGDLGRLVERLRARGTIVRVPAELCDEVHRFGEARVEVLWPCPGAEEVLSENDNSLVLRLSHGARSALLAGDAELEAEQAMLARDPARLRADLLKVGHHGSHTSTSPPFVEAVDPSDAMISCGVRNRFGHPRPSTLSTLGARGVRIHRTDRSGERRWWTDGRSTWTSDGRGLPVAR
jgi:competence protein ComEC